MNEIYSDESVSIQIDQKNSLLSISWKAYVSPGRLAALINSFAQMISVFKIKNLLIDASECSLEYSELKIEGFAKIFAKNEIHKIARVISKNIFNESKINTYLKSEPRLKAFRAFSDVGEALYWLRLPAADDAGMD